MSMLGDTAKSVSEAIASVTEVGQRWLDDGDQT
jgi:hypothetical protein